MKTTMCYDVMLQYIIIATLFPTYFRIINSALLSIMLFASLFWYKE